MSGNLSSCSFEKHLADVEGDFLPEHIDEVRKGFEAAGLSTNVVRLIDSADNTQSGTEVAGLYDVQNDSVGLASMDVIERISKGGTGAIRKQVWATLFHERRHQKSRKQAKQRGELGVIAEHLGSENNMLLQELMASKGTESLDAYEDVRSRALSVVSQIGMTRDKLVNLLYLGRESEIVEFWYN